MFKRKSEKGGSSKFLCIFLHNSAMKRKCLNRSECNSTGNATLRIGGSEEKEEDGRMCRTLSTLRFVFVNITMAAVII